MKEEKKRIRYALQDLISDVKYFLEDIENGEYPEFENREFSEHRLEEAKHLLDQAYEKISAIN